MLALALALTLGQLDAWSPPPLVRADAPTQLAEELSDLRRLTSSLRTQVDIGRQMSDLSVEIASFDTSGPGWAKGARVIGYLLAVPAFAFAAPVISGRTPAATGLLIFSNSQTYDQVNPTFNTLGVALAITAGVALVLGITGGIVGWISKTMELDGLVAQRESLVEELAHLRTEEGAVASRR
jgi:hypothetical protein